MAKGPDQSCSRKGQPTQSGALPHYKSPSTQLEPVKGCAHPAESAVLGRQPAPLEGRGERAGVCLCMCTCVRVPYYATCLCVLMHVSLWACLYLSYVCLWQGEHIYMPVDSCVCNMLVHPYIFVTECVCICLFIPTCSVCVPVSVWMLVWVSSCLCALKYECVYGCTPPLSLCACLLACAHPGVCMDVWNCRVHGPDELRGM